MSRLRCDECGLVYQRAAIARQMTLSSGVACRRCGGLLQSEHPEPDSDARTTVVAVRSVVGGPERLPYS